MRHMGIFDFFKSKTIDITEPFPKNECTSLVIYATKTPDDNPDQTSPSFVSHDFDPETSALNADVAPYLTVHEASELLHEIRKWKATAFDDSDFKIGADAERWISNKMGEGWKCFMYELEPKKHAGAAYEWARQSG
ncbi:MAG: hypothetical protein AB8B55_11610 [Mariniblastus sp.]